MIFKVRLQHSIVALCSIGLLLILLSCTTIPQSTSVVTPSVANTTVPPPSPPETPASFKTEPRLIQFTTSDEVILKGTLYGTGTKGVIFSNINQGDQTAWQDIPQAVQVQGYVALTYNYRGLDRSAEARAQKVEDLKAAIAFMHTQGVQDIVLVGASIGGAASINAAVEVDPAGLVVISSSMTIDGLTITDEDLQTIAAPKLFLNSEADKFGTTPDSERMFEVASEPKQLFLYSGNAHGTELLNGEHKEVLVDQVLKFVTLSLEN